MKTIPILLLLAFVALQALGGTIIDDTFIGSAGNLTGHTGPNGEAWTSLSGTISITGSGTAYESAGSGTSYYVNNKFGSTVNQTVSLTLSAQSGSPTIVGLVGWSDTSSANGYVAFYVPGSPNQVTFYKIVSSSSTLLTVVTQTILNGDILSMRLSVGSQIIAVNGTTIITGTDTSVPTPTPSTMVSGLSTGDDCTTTTGTHISEFKVVDNGSGVVFTNNAPQILKQGISTVTLQSEPSGGTLPYTFAWYSSTTPDFTTNSGNLISGQTSSNITISVSSTPLYVRCAAADSASASGTSYQRMVLASPSQSLSLVVCSDSTRVVPDTTNNCTVAVQTILEQHAGAGNVNLFDQAVSGSATPQWLPGQANMLAADAAIATITNRFIISVELDINDVQGSISTNTHYQNLTNIVGHLLADENSFGQTCTALFLDYGGWREPGYYNSSNPVFTEDYSVTILQYAVLDATLPSLFGSKVHMGDTKSLFDFAQYPQLFMVLDSGDPAQIGRIHPSVVGAKVMGANIASPIVNFLYPTGVSFAY